MYLGVLRVLSNEEKLMNRGWSSTWNIQSHVAKERGSTVPTSPDTP